MIAVYLRLSMADGDLGVDGKDESNSIDNQRSIINDYINRKGDLDGEVIEYIDDGFSGTNFNRPAFTKLLEDMKAGKVNVVITKDLSRLGRNYIEVGDYMEQIFPTLGVRYIAVNSNYDSNDYIGKTMGLDYSVMNLVNSLYSRDLSKKYRTAVETKWKSGISTSGRPPFGYIRDPNNKGKWVIDPIAADTVIMIFEMAAAGHVLMDIVNTLNTQHIMTPGQYREMRGHVRHVSRKVADDEWLWTYQTLSRIIKQYEYTGALVQSKRKRIAVGSSSTRQVPESDRIVVKNHHEAIIDEDTFWKARSVIKEQKKGAVIKVCDEPLSKVVYCGNCGLKMLLEGKKYYCRHKAVSGGASKCSDIRYPADAINKVAADALKTQIAIIENLTEEMKIRKPEIINNDTVIKEIEDALSACQIDKTRAYESYASGIITKDAYIHNRDNINCRITNLKERRKAITDSFSKTTELSDAAQAYLGAAGSLSEMSFLSKDAVDTFIQRITIYDSKHIEIKFKFDDLIEQMVTKKGTNDEYWR